MSPDEEEQTEAAPEAEASASDAAQTVEQPAAAAPDAAPDAAPEAATPEAPVAAAAEASEPAKVESAGDDSSDSDKEGAPASGGSRSYDRGDRRGGDDDDDRGGGRRRFFGRRKVCAFCVEKAKSIDYKDAGKLRRYVSDRGRIEARRRTGTCAKHQRWLATALKRARHLALLPYSPEHIRISGAFAPRR